MPDLSHLTVLTGHTRMSPRSEVADHVVSGLQVIIARGGGAAGNTGWAVLIVERSPDGAIFDLSHRGVEVVLGVSSPSLRHWSSVCGSKLVPIRPCPARSLPSQRRCPGSPWGSSLTAWRCSGTSPT